MPKVPALKPGAKLVTFYRVRDNWRFFQNEKIPEFSIEQAEYQETEQLYIRTGFYRTRIRKGYILNEGWHPTPEAALAQFNAEATEKVQRLQRELKEAQERHVRVGAFVAAPSEPREFT